MNVEGKNTMVRNGKTLKCCLNYFSPTLIRCFSNNFLNREDFKKKMAEERNEEPKKGMRILATKDYDLSLQEIFKAEDFSDLNISV